ncbi:hypothetical protein D3C77_635340 [compost metagenome]
MTWVQPLISLIDASIGQVREVAARLHQVCLAVQVTPDNPYLLAATLAAQIARQFVFALGSLRSTCDLRAQFSRRKAAIQFTAADQIEEHGGVAQHLFENKIAGSGYSSELIPTFVGPVIHRQ